MEDLNHLNELAKINSKVKNFSLQVLYQGTIKTIQISDFKEKWIVLFFYPGDFTFVCPTELEELAEKYNKFTEINTEVISISTDSVFVHQAWKNDSQAIAKVKFPMASDITNELSKYFNVYVKEEGVALRGTFLIDPDGILKMIEINNNDIGRNADELLRKIQAAQFVREHNGQVCPASWKPGDKTLEPNLSLVGKI